MNTAILISFSIPAIVATVLTIMLIQERDYFFRNKHQNEPLENRKTNQNKQRTNPSNDLDNWDLSGGTLGF